MQNSRSKKVDSNFQGIIYRLPTAAARALVTKTTPWSVVNTQEWLCNYIDESAGLLRKCVKVELF